MKRVKILKYLDKIVGLLAVRLMPTPRPSHNLDAIRSVLFIRPGGIGDAVLLIPAILAFRETYADARITVLAEQRNGAVFSLCPAVDELLYYDRACDFLKVVVTKFDVVVDTEQWHRLSAVVARATCSPLLSGFGTNERRRLFTHAIPYSHDKYEAESFFQLLKPLAVSEPMFHRQYLVVPEAAAEKVAELLMPMTGQAFAVIFTGASIPERRWGAENFKELAERLDALQIRSVVVGGMADVTDSEKILKNIRGLNMAGKTSLVETASIIEKSTLLISADSGILHIGVGLGKPTVSLFGPGIEEKWAPRGDRHIVINKHLPCSPCTKFGYTPKCPIKARCMADISVDEVAEAVRRLLEKTKKV